MGQSFRSAAAGLATLALGLLAASAPAGAHGVGGAHFANAHFSGPSLSTARGSGRLALAGRRGFFGHGRVFAGFGAPYWSGADEALAPEWTGYGAQFGAGADAGFSSVTIVNAAMAAADPAGGLHGDCLITRLRYDRAGHYMGQRVIPACR